MKRCYSCKREWAEKRSPGFREECSGCATPLHACRNCRFYDGTASAWCREPQAREGRPRDPEASNVCDWFVFAEAQGEEIDRSEVAKQGLAALFGETVDGSPSATSAAKDWQRIETPPRCSLADLFGPGGQDE